MRPVLAVCTGCLCFARKFSSYLHQHRRAQACNRALGLWYFSMALNRVKVWRTSAQGVDPTANGFSRQRDHLSIVEGLVRRLKRAGRRGCCSATGRRMGSVIPAASSISIPARVRAVKPRRLPTGRRLLDLTTGEKLVNPKFRLHRRGCAGTQPTFRTVVSGSERG